LSLGVLALVSVALLLLCAYLVYGSVDQSVSLEHARAAQRSLEQDRAVLQKLTADLVRGTRRADVTALLATKHAAHLVKEEGDTIFIDGVGLRFRGDDLVAVVFLDDADGSGGTVGPHLAGC
jgi:predicted DNA repair protein MutK